MDAQGFYNWGLSVGSIAGIRIRLHWLLLGFWLYELNWLMQREPPLHGMDLLFFWVLGMGLIFGSILLHEFGHCFAARWVGGTANDVLLWPLGGLAMCTAPNLPRSQFIVAAGGPAVTLLIAGVSYVAFEIVGANKPSLVGTSGYHYSYYLLVEFQLFLLILNLVPLYPLDGGRMFHSGLWGYFSRREPAGAYGRASLYTVYAARVTAVLGAIYALFILHELWLAFIFAWAWMGAENLRRQVQAGGDEDYVFGYDFSRGYTSLGEGSKPHRRRPGPLSRWLGGRKRKTRGRRQPTPEDKQRVDELLDKINREGMSSLTKAERRFLEKASRWWS